MTNRSLDELTHYCGFNRKQLDYLNEKSLYGLSNRFSDYFNREVINLNITPSLQLDIKSTETKISIVELGVKFKVHNISHDDLNLTIDSIIKNNNKNNSND